MNERLQNIFRENLQCHVLHLQRDLRVINNEFDNLIYILEIVETETCS